MMLSEVAPVAAQDLPVSALRDHLRLGVGFADASAGEAVLEGCLRAALAAIEGRTGKVLLARDFLLVRGGWRFPDTQPLPVAPVSALGAVVLTDAAGAETDLSARVALRADMQRPQIVARGAALPEVALGGKVSVLFTAGFGPWAKVPADLRQAVLLLAAEYYERRHGGAGEAVCLPLGILALIEPWRTVRVLGGGAA